ncbi:MAG: hypothetical protein G01um101418_639 [Parcubacteria group bacterium Gr01-1014_18]|nr:MAG: hypothetical protein Greene041636_650 [Parcubacteria group bacterium Greene0416_36]TSC80720.1 MAG: hypothetical protein G01um101418_639 [Parcubacteria group bacterium Gr01-1014_18]TSC98669.1 MAG: hypothetical protein Greene101420_628 [Parcubacteria group bacterium Greene1014_20]TSD07171.1 MAG: hypothetical protein Greene07142_340 [Parcubacteria group bacterium Greene0714_2]
MSHIKTEKVSCAGIHPAILTEGIKVLSKMLELEGILVTPYILDWAGKQVTTFQGMSIVSGLDAKGAASNSALFPGMGLGVDKLGQLAIMGDFYSPDQQSRAEVLRQKVENLLGGACCLAARMFIAEKQQQKFSLTVNSDKQLELLVEI